MELTKNGSIKVDGARLMRTGDDKWSVSMGETFLGTAHDIAEAITMVAEHKRKVRERLAAVEAKAAARYTDERMRDAENRRPIEG